MNPEFFVGYVPHAPPGIARRIRRTVIALSALALSIAILLVLAQNHFADARFEYGIEKSWEGELDLKPHPALIVNPSESYWLVGTGKYGAGPLQPGKVRITGSLIERDDIRMIEILSVNHLGPGTPALTEKNLGPFEATGEIVDTKCYLGVMNPGEGKVHADCAAHCLRGGIPAAFAFQDAVGNRQLLFIDGPLYAKPATRATLHGTLIDRGGRLILRTE